MKIINILFYFLLFYIFIINCQNNNNNNNNNNYKINIIIYDNKNYLILNNSFSSINETVLEILKYNITQSDITINIESSNDDDIGKDIVIKESTYFSNLKIKNNNIKKLSIIGSTINRIIIDRSNTSKFFIQPSKNYNFISNIQFLNGPLVAIGTENDINFSDSCIMEFKNCDFINEPTRNGLDIPVLKFTNCNFNNIFNRNNDFYGGFNSINLSMENCSFYNIKNNIIYFSGRYDNIKSTLSINNINIYNNINLKYDDTLPLMAIDDYFSININNIFINNNTIPNLLRYSTFFNYRVISFSNIIISNNNFTNNLPLISTYTGYASSNITFSNLTFNNNIYNNSKNPVLSFLNIGDNIFSSLEDSCNTITNHISLDSVQLNDNGYYNFIQSNYTNLQIQNYNKFSTISNYLIYGFNNTINYNDILNDDNIIDFENHLTIKKCNQVNYTFYSCEVENQIEPIPIRCEDGYRVYVNVFDSGAVLVYNNSFLTISESVANLKPYFSGQYSISIYLDSKNDNDFGKTVYIKELKYFTDIPFKLSQLSITGSTKNQIIIDGSDTTFSFCPFWSKTIISNIQLINWVNTNPIFYFSNVMFQSASAEISNTYFSNSAIFIVNNVEPIISSLSFNNCIFSKIRNVGFYITVVKLLFNNCIFTGQSGQDLKFSVYSTDGTMYLNDIIFKDNNNQIFEFTGLNYISLNNITINNQKNNYNQPVIAVYNCLTLESNNISISKSSFSKLLQFSNVISNGYDYNFIKFSNFHFYNNNINNSSLITLNKIKKNLNMTLSNFIIDNNNNNTIKINENNTASSFLNFINSTSDNSDKFHYLYLESIQLIDNNFINFIESNYSNIQIQNNNNISSISNYVIYGFNNTIRYNNSINNNNNNNNNNIDFNNQLIIKNCNQVNETIYPCSFCKEINNFFYLTCDNETSSSSDSNGYNNNDYNGNKIRLIISIVIPTVSVITIFLILVIFIKNKNMKKLKQKQVGGNIIQLKDLKFEIESSNSMIDVASVNNCDNISQTLSNFMNDNNLATIDK